MKRTFGVWARALAGALLLTGGAAWAQDAVKQIELTAKQVESFIAAQKDMAAITEKLPEPAPDQPLDAKTKSELESVAKKYGFKNLEDYDDVSSNIGMIMSGFDSKTKTFLSPPGDVEEEDR